MTIQERLELIAALAASAAADIRDGRPDELPVTVEEIRNSLNNVEQALDFCLTRRGSLESTLGSGAVR